MAEWYSYDWELSGQPAAFHVDLSYVAEFDTLGDFTTLLYVSCLSNNPQALSFTARERRHLNDVFKDCARVLKGKSVYVGYIDMLAQRRYYFYVSDARLLVPMLSVCKDDGVLRLNCTKAAEPNRQTYYRLLVPDAAKRQSNDNIRYIESLRERGDDNDAPRRVNLHFYFPTVQGRSLFAAEIREAGFALGKDDYIPEQELPYYLVIHRVSPLRKDAITHLTTQAIECAAPYGGTLAHLDSGLVLKRGIFG